MSTDMLGVVLPTDMLCYEVAEYTSMRELTALCSASHQHHTTLLAVVRRKSWQEMRNRLVSKLRAPRARGKCAVCDRGTMHLIDLSARPCVVYEGGPYCSQHCFTMQNVSATSVLWRLRKDTTSDIPFSTVSYL